MQHVVYKHETEQCGNKINESVGFSIGGGSRRCSNIVLSRCCSLVLVTPRTARPVSHGNAAAARRSPHPMSRLKWQTHSLISSPGIMSWLFFTFRERFLTGTCMKWPLTQLIPPTTSSLYKHNYNYFISANNFSLKLYWIYKPSLIQAFITLSKIFLYIKLHNNFTQKLKYISIIRPSW